MGEKDFMGQPISPDAPASSAAERVLDVPPGRPPNWPLQSFDARDWGAAFCRIGRARGLDLDDEDESWIVGWFANALMKGWDEQRRRTDAEAARPRVETTPAGATVATPDNDLAALTRERDEARAEENYLRAEAMERAKNEYATLAFERGLEIERLREALEMAHQALAWATHGFTGTDIAIRARDHAAQVLALSAQQSPCLHESPVPKECAKENLP